MKRIVIITGFEAFNASLYRDAAQKAIARCPDLEVLTFNDRDLASQPEAVAQALQGADVFFTSLIFDYDQVIWLRERVENIPVRLVFESALELMALTRLGKFVIGEQPKGMPKPIKFILSKFTNSKEEDKLAGYLSFLKTGPKLLKYIPAKKVQDLRNWLIIYGYWNAGGTDNVAAMCWAIAENYLGLEIGELPAVVETPNLGLLHPDHEGYFLSPQKYLDWHRQSFPEQKLNPVVAVLLYRKHVVTKQPYIPQLIRKFEADGLVPLPIFINGVEAHVIVRDWLTTDYEQHQRLHGQVAIKSLKADAVKVEGIVSTIGFPLVGGPAGSMEAGRQVEVAKSILSAKNIPYLVAAPLLIQDLHSWTRQGIGGLQSVVLYALPELDGAIDTIPLGGLVGEEIYLIPERVKRLTGRLKNWIRLKNTAPGDRQLAILLYGFPPGYGATGTAALLNVPKSLVHLLKVLQAAGYDVGNFPEDGEEIIRLVKAADEAYRLDPALAPQQTLENIDLKTMDRWLGYLLTQKIEKQWQSLTNTGLKTFGGKCQVGGIQFGKVWIGVQPPLGISGDPMRLMFEKDLTPHPQYAAFYKWLQNEFRADALIHFGMHGTVEWLPGSPLGNTSYSWSDILLGNLPNLYIYAANNPSESILAKRRGYGTLISHNVPPYGRAGLYKELLVLRDLIGEYREDPEKNDALRPDIIQKIVDLGLPEDCPFTVGQEQGIAFTVENASLFSKNALQNYFVHIYEYLQTLEQRLFSSGLHVLGEKPSPEIIQSYLTAYFGDRLSENVLAKVAQGEQEIICDQPDLLTEAREIGDRLLQTDEEIVSLLKGLNGEYIPPAPGGDLLRDGLGVLPTGRNIHALDPYRMPSPAAYARGREIGKKIIQQHLEETGNYPETVAVMLWGLDAIKTKGESLGILLELVGAEPIKEGTGRIVRYGLLPLEVVGHPRIDILANLSGIFRDSFVNIIELLDDLFHRAATIDEDPAQNFIRKHSLELQAEGVENTTARLFSNPAGDFGSLVNDQIVEGNWNNSDELAKTWEGRNQYSYGRNDKGQARPEVLKKLLQTGDRLVQEIDSVEYGLTDIQEYYANTGGLKKAAENASGKTVTASFVESFSKDTTPRKLESVLRTEYRSKLLNPKWAEAMADQGSGGAYEISQRMTALIGWGGTVDFQDQWVYDQAAETYALDAAMAQKLREANPEAFRNIVGRMLEAHGRGFWEASDEQLQKLSDLYDLTDDVLEGITT
ncbi:magnesium chelatase subunit H [Picosynechococcus sp. PCC 8807]|uniref:magnesium chelatase subunit H n=1 Tax=Picosynechococcus sp. PCC 8807 TaxID=195248 RepID=UPI0008103CF5|nr:magnesium chelatase subunit H [Picosynechococcus sp. PCC 8807]ANV90054.1 magnesium chelatase subunit H [Picosynechococcus sp. PCC 8807]